MFVLRGTYVTEYVYIDKITGFYPFTLRFPSFLFSLSNKTIFSTQPVMPQITFNTSIYIYTPEFKLHFMVVSKEFPVEGNLAVGTSDKHILPGSRRVQALHQ